MDYMPANAGDGIEADALLLILGAVGDDRAYRRSSNRADAGVLALRFAYGSASLDFFDYIEFFCKRTRRHSKLGILSPVDFEEVKIRI
jgi:hypothetical protein